MVNYDEIINEIINDNYYVISINYEKKDGIKTFKNLEELKQNFDEEFYLLYIFNKNRMYKIINVDNEITKILVMIDENNVMNYTRKFYIKDGKKIEITYFINENGDKYSYFSGIEV